MQKHFTTEERFWAKVDKSGDCWIWTGYLNPAGYGNFRMGVKGNRKTFLTHRVSWMLSSGEIPQGMQICHKCDNPKCVNPNHLFVGTQTDNLNDCWGKRRFVRKDTRKTHCAKGHEYSPENTYVIGGRRRACRVCLKRWNAERYLREKAKRNGEAGNGGRKLGNAKLTPGDVVQMREMKANGKTCRSIAKAFGIHPTSVSAAVLGNSWKGIDPKSANKRKGKP